MYFLLATASLIATFGSDFPVASASKTNPRLSAAESEPDDSVELSSADRFLGGKKKKCKPRPSPVTVISSTALSAEDLTPAFEAFRGLLGGDNNGNGFSADTRGHRQINWDAEVVPFDMPGDFFANTVPRGALLTVGAGSGVGEFRVSDVSGLDNVDVKFDSIVDGEVSESFRRFSDFRLFSPLEKNKFNVEFVVPNTDGVPATVSGFGAVFVGVDKSRKTRIEYFAESGCLLAREYVQPQPNGLSFLGVDFGRDSANIERGNAIVSKVKITLGTTPLEEGNEYGKKDDIVVMDDFLYGEPQPTVPLL